MRHRPGAWRGVRHETHRANGVAALPAQVTSGDGVAQPRGKKYAARLTSDPVRRPLCGLISILYASDTNDQAESLLAGRPYDAFSNVSRINLRLRQCTK